jgi:magnesium-transporting ATPase (P-type)
MVIKNKYIKRRWLDFRNGHSIYLVFLLSLVNFILIVYNFAILKIPFISSFLNLPLFIVIFFLIYIPAAILIGYWHRRNQYAVENEALIQENWIFAWIAIYQIRLIKGKTSPEEDDAVLNYINSILIRTKKDDLLKLASKDRDPLK